MSKNNEGNNKKVPFTGIGLIFGTAIGAGLSIILTGNTVIWAGMGTGIGLVIGAMADSYYRKS
ncbi:MAG: hypothetical protein NUK57_08240 [Gudongella sp.]|nr:hypothetical protein [Gudongella sp.]